MLDSLRLRGSESMQRIPSSRWDGRSIKQVLAGTKSENGQQSMRAAIMMTSVDLRQYTLIRG
jgi:hypothetical protein|tara:strand:- start:3439 stop:3624 length:186 start_codon:yes stop_codon:yes gene_type:complete